MKTRDDVVRAQLKYKYDMSLEEWNEMFAVQKGRCKICGKHSSELTKRLCVDYCKRRKKVRGLVCGNCTIMLSRAQNDPAILVSAAKYLGG